MDWVILVIAALVAAGIALVLGRSFGSGRRGAAEGEWGGRGGTVSPPLVWVGTLFVFVLVLLVGALIVSQL